MALGGSGKGIQIIVGTDYNDRDLKRAQRDLDRLKREAGATMTPMQKLGTTMRGMVGPAFAMAGAAAGAFAVKLAVDGVQAAMAEERELAILKQTLDNVGQSFAMDSVNEFIDDLRFLTGVSDSELRPAFANFIGATRDAESAQKLLAVAVDASVGSGRDLSSVATAVAKAVGGSSGSLKRLIPELDATTIAGGGAEKVIAALEERFGGSAEAAAGTFAGQIARLKDGFEELQESFGAGFLKQLEDSTSKSGDLAQALRDLQPAAEEIGATFGKIAQFLADNREIISYYTAAIQMNLGLVSGAVKGVEFAWKGLTGVITGEWPWADTEEAIVNVTNAGTDMGTEMAAAAKDIYRTTMDNNDAFKRQYFTLEEVRGGAGRYTDDMSLLRAELRRTTSHLGFLATAFDTANAAMERRAAMQNYRDALASFIEEPSAETRDAVVEAMIGAAESFDDPTKQAEFTATAVGKIEDAARLAGVNVPGWLSQIGTAAQNQLDPVASLKRELELIPRNIPVTITVTTRRVGDPPPDRDTEFPASGGYITNRRSLGRGPDTVPAMLTPGEFVIRRQAVKQFGADLFSQLNRGINPLAGMSPTGNGRSAGLNIGTINVTSVAGERAETSLPRALRRMAYLAGV